MFEKLPKQISELIKEEVENVRKEYQIDNLIIRNDIFGILERLCTILQYPLDDDEDANGVHVERWVNGEKKHFVFINSSNPLEKQVYTAAHELGHVWKIDEKIARKSGNTSLDAEAIINRFAAELLMPQGIFIKKLYAYCHEVGIQSGAVEEDDILPIIVRLMNDFMVPYKAVVYRLEELDIIKKCGRIQLENIEYNSDERLTNLMKKGNFLNLNQVKRQKTMGNIEKMLIDAEKRELYSQNKIEAIRRKFDLSEPERSEERTEIKVVIPEA